MKSGATFFAALLLGAVFGGSSSLIVKADIVASTSLSGHQTEPSIAVSPVDNNIVLVGSMKLDNTLQPDRLQYFISRDGGQTWPTAGEVQGAFGKPTLADAAVAFDNQGIAWYLGMEATSLGGFNCDKSLFVTSDASVSGSWSTPTLVALGHSGTCHDKPFLAIDNSDVLYVAWTRFDYTTGITVNDIFLNYGRPPAAFNGAIRISSDNDSHFSDVDAAPDGTVYISWVSVASRSIRIARFDPAIGQVMYSYPVRVLTETNRPIRQIQTLAVDWKDSNIVYVTYEDTVSGTTRAHKDVFLTKSTDGGQT